MGQMLSLTEGEFENVDVDKNGKFYFSNTLQKLRRSIKGLHDKVFPTFVMNDASNPVPVTLNGIGQFTGLSSQSRYASDGSTGSYQVPLSKKWIICFLSANYVGSATGAVRYYASDGTTLKQSLLANSTTESNTQNLTGGFIIGAGEYVKILNTGAFSYYELDA